MTDARERVSDQAFFCSSRASRLMEKHDIKLLNFRALRDSMRRNATTAT
jgi:hypothetical protein